MFAFWVFTTDAQLSVKLCFLTTDQLIYLSKRVRSGRWRNERIILTRVSQKFCNILVTLGTIWQLQMLFLWSWRWRTTEKCNMASSLNTLCTHQICHTDLEHSLRIYSFRRTENCLIVKILATQAKFLESSGYCTVIKCAFIFSTIDIFDYTFIFVVFKSRTGWSNAQRVSTPITTILPTTAGGFNGFGQGIYAPLIWTYQNIARLLTHLSI